MDGKNDKLFNIVIEFETNNRSDWTQCPSPNIIEILDIKDLDIIIMILYPFFSRGLIQWLGFRLGY